MRLFTRTRLAELVDRERRLYEELHPGSKGQFERSDHLLARVPMTWMAKWAGGFPLALAGAHGAEITDIDGNVIVDFALGDTGAMAGHSPPALVDALARRAGELGGVTTMMPTEDAEWVAAELSRRFGMAKWSFTLSATDANRWLLRLVRLVTSRPKILVFSYCYHGSVDESLVVATGAGAAIRPGNVAPAYDPTTSTKVVEFNDLAALAEALAPGDVAAVLTEPALTNIGIVLPEPGFLEGVRRLCDETGTLLIIDETHTFSAGPGGATKRWALRPDAVTIGKSIGGGVPSGAYGLSEELAADVLAATSRRTRGIELVADIVDVGGVGGTLAGNALSLAAMRAVLGEVLTDEAFAHMEATCDVFAAGARAAIETRGLPWSLNQLGARCEYRFISPAPLTGGVSALGGDDELEEYLHLHAINRGVMHTPLHNMALMCPATTLAHVAAHQEAFELALDELVD